MSSEAAAYFPDALASTSEVCEAAHRTSEIPSALPNLVQPQIDTSESSVNFITQIPGISDETLMEQVCRLLSLPDSPRRCRFPGHQLASST
jgi:RNA polymerase sigma-70 factor (ECF subfamily)